METELIPKKQTLSAEERRRNLSQMATAELDLLIVGGGVNGGWAALDASLRGLRVGLVEAFDFGHGPSRNNSELLHGGFRYLKEWYQRPQNWFKIASVLHLVRDALREREVLMKIAPHLARPIPFCMPLYAPQGLRLAKRAFYAVGFWMYDLLSAAQTIAPFTMLNSEETQQKLRGIQAKGLAGCGIYYDCKMEPGRFIAEIIKTASAQGALLANYTRAIEPIWDDSREDVQGFRCQDLFDQQIYEIRARRILDVTGPWGDEFRRQVWPEKKHSLRLSKGIHIMVPQLFSEPIACAFFADDDRIIFIIPWGENYNYSLIGTTDTDYHDQPDRIAPDQKSIDYLVAKVRALFPKADLTCHGNYAGIRPLIRQERGSASSVSREHVIQRQGRTRITSVFGGKWTTARLVAKETIDLLFPETQGSSKTHLIRFGGDHVQALMQGSLAKPDPALLAMGKELNLSLETLEHLVFSYGRNARDLLEMAKKDRAGLQPISPGMPFLAVEVTYAVRNEMAMRVVDFLIRRSIFGRLRDRGLEAAPTVARIMAQELGWDERRQEQEVHDFEESTRIVTPF